jgi:ketosteroid isomerase-like protein
MSAPVTNVDVVRHCIDAISQRDAATLTEFSADDVEVRPLRAMLEDTVYRGREGIAQWMHDIDDMWAELWIEIESIEEPDPGYVVAHATVHGRGHESDVPTQMRVDLTAHLRDGLVTQAATVASG